MQPISASDWKILDRFELPNDWLKSFFGAFGPAGKVILEESDKVPPIYNASKILDVSFKVKVIGK